MKEKARCGFGFFSHRKHRKHRMYESRIGYVEKVMVCMEESG
jgi:hypothetical protein